jgi:hypothetical protein
MKLEEYIGFVPDDLFSIYIFTGGGDGDGDGGGGDSWERDDLVVVLVV